jgi:hypothetical protein
MTFEQEQVVNRLSQAGEFKTYECTEQNLADPIFRRQIRSLLQNGFMLIEFTKTNGETRVMSCTLNEGLGARFTSTVHLEESAPSGSAAPRKQNDEVCAVWDVKAEAWRSFRWSNLKKIDFVIPNTK